MYGDGDTTRPNAASDDVVPTADLPKSAGHPLYERLNRVLDEAGFDAFVEAQCASFYADGVGRPSLAPGRCLASSTSAAQRQLFLPARTGAPWTTHAGGRTGGPLAFRLFAGRCCGF